MKITLYVLAIIAIAGGAYFSFDYSQKFKLLQAEIEKFGNTSSVIEEKAIAKEKEIKKERVKLTVAQEKQGLLTQNVDSLTSSAMALKNQAAKAEKDQKAQDIELAKEVKSLEEAKTILAELGGDLTLEALPDKIKEIENDVTSKRKKLEEIQTLASGATVSLANQRAEIDRISKKSVERSARISRNSTEAVITAVNQEWGFVVIGAGSNSGFTPKTILIIERDGRSIGRVNPSSIEPNQTIAEIDLQSLGNGVRILPGDRVILAKLATN